MKEITISGLTEFIDSSHYKIKQNNILLKGFNSIKNARKNEITFCKNEDETAISKIRFTKSLTIICPINLENKLENIEKNLFFVKNPRLMFLKCMNFYLKSKPKPFVHSSAIVESNHSCKSIPQ